MSFKFKIKNWRYSFRLYRDVKGYLSEFFHHSVTLKKKYFSVESIKITYSKMLIMCILFILFGYIISKLNMILDVSVLYWYKCWVNYKYK